MALRMCLHWNVGSCRTICFYLNPTTSCFCSTFSLWNSRYIGAAHLGASLCVVCEEKKVFKNMFCQTGAVLWPSVTQLHMSGIPVRSVVNAGSRLLFFELWYQPTEVCLLCQWFVQFVGVRSCWQFLHAFQMWRRLIVVHMACWCYSCRCPTLHTI